MPNFCSISRPVLLALLLGGALPLAQGQPAEQQPLQVPGVYRLMVGEMQVTALHDGVTRLGTGLLAGAPAEMIEARLAAQFLASSEGVPTAVNAYLVHTGEQLVLVDSGAASCFGPSLGQLLSNLRAAGYAPEQVDAVLLTHLHPDHVCGLRDAAGRAVFERAHILVPKAEADHWLDDARLAAVPAEAQGSWRMAREALAPYAQTGRLQIFEPDTLQIPGIRAQATPGHTPGHTSYLLESAGERLLLWGDIVHSHAVQFAAPEVTIEFDSDKPQAIATRRRVLAASSDQALPVAGSHLPFPGIGHVRREGDGYVWVPLEFSPLPVR